MTLKCQMPSNLSAVGVVPNNWRVVRAKVLYRERRQLSQNGEGELLSASHLTGISKRSDKDVGMFLAESLEGYKVVYPSDCVVNTMWAWMGALGISSIEGLISPSYAVYQPVFELDDGFYDYLFRTKSMIAEINRNSKGVWSSRLRLYPNDFLNLQLPYPDIYIQRQIADFLDQETYRIQELIDRKQRFQQSVANRISALVDQAISNTNTPFVRFEHITSVMRRPAILSEHAELVRLGLYNRGRGMFKKPAADEEGMGDSEFFFVEDGDLILSGQFAWEGAVALATAEEEGCVVSHRYPVYRGKSGVSTSYLLGLLRSNYGDFILNEASRGSAGRNRPLNVRRLGKEKIPVPESSLQIAVERAVDFERRLKGKTEQSISRLGEFRAALITAAVTGQIDVSTWGKQGEMDRCLDHIDAETSLRKAHA